MSNQNRERRGSWNPRLTHFFRIFGNSTLRNFRPHFSRNKIKSLESCGACELKRLLQNILRPYHRGCNENEGFKKTRSCVFNHFRNSTVEFTRIFGHSDLATAHFFVGMFKRKNYNNFSFSMLS